MSRFIEYKRSDGRDIKKPFNQGLSDDACRRVNRANKIIQRKGLERTREINRQLKGKKHH